VLNRRWFRRAVGLFVVLVLVAGLWCAMIASRPGNESFAAKAADWMRDNHLESVANWLERQWYTHQAPGAGGVPSREISVPAPTVTVPPPVQPVVTIPSSVLPPAIVPLASPPLENEGLWTPIGPVVDGHPTMATAQLRPDSVHTSVLGAVVWMDPKLVHFLNVPGTVEPGGDYPVVGTVPMDQRTKWIAAFNSGFRMKDSRGGFFAQGREARPLEDGAASLVIRNDRTVDVGMWGRDDRMDANIASVRQNLALIVDGGQPVPGLDSNDRSKWGHTLGNKVLVWRSGIGVRPDGTLVYAASNGLSVETLAGMFVAAGCVRAMELDINPEWVTFNIFDHPDPADPAAIQPSKLLPDMQRPAARFLGDDSRDFIAVFAG
jgi:hypothetical protein